MRKKKYYVLFDQYFKQCIHYIHVKQRMLGPHWIRCTTEGVHTASQIKATAIYVLSELRFSCPHRKDLRSHREGTCTPSGVYQRKTTTIVTLYVKTSFDTRTLIG